MLARASSGYVVWATGLPCVGKTTLGRAVVAELSASRPAQLLDGDEVRAALGGDADFSDQGRLRNVRTISLAARLLARHGVAVFVACIAPRADARAEVRAACDAEGIPYLEIYLRAPRETLVQRDVKGHYRRALAGQIARFTGISDGYQEPQAPELVIDTEREPVEQSLTRVRSLLQGRGLLLPPQRKARRLRRTGKRSRRTPLREVLRPA
jgi:adenylyl-sulfate kinase